MTWYGIGDIHVHDQHAKGLGGALGAVRGTVSTLVSSYIA